MSKIKVTQDELQTAFADTIIALRKKRGMSQREVAHRMGCPRTYISKIENNRAMPTYFAIMRLGKALRCTAWTIMYNTEQRLITTNPTALDIDTSESVIINDVEQVAPNQLEV